MPRPAQQPWLDLRLGTQGPSAAQEGPDEFARLWRGFMTARVTLGLVLLGLQATLYALGQSSHPILILVCAAYVGVTLVTRIAGKAQRLGASLGLRWVAIVGVDVGSARVQRSRRGAPPSVATNASERGHLGRRAGGLPRLPASRL